ncbi:MAG: hypothetical protein HWD62_00590 [Cyclobacteriaceae bacterium]|nr:MAG: hypothetical protein HWD62_00590 [Cyclobacteriaceae bacterium]
MQLVAFDKEVKYVGGDIVPMLIQKNTQSFASERHTFIQLDILKDKLISADVIFVRHCLVHLCYADIRLFLQNLAKSDIKYLLTTSFPLTKNNYDITTGDWRAINLQRKPFCFPAPLAVINERTTENKFQYFDKSLNLYKVSDLLSLEFIKPK